MDEDEVLRCLAEADAGRLRPELTGGRYVTVAYLPGGVAEREEFDGESAEDDDTEGIDVLGEATSVYEALDLIATDLVGAGDMSAEEILETVGEDMAESLGEYPALAAVHSAGRRLVAAAVLGWLGPMDASTTGFTDDVYLGAAPLLFAGSRFVLLTSAAPPHQEVAFGILRLQPVGRPTDADRALFRAAEQGDPGAVTAALATGAAVDALDERGMSPLHAAVAHRRPAAVAALLAAGADPASQADYGNAPHFAAVGPRGVVASAARAVDGPDHAAVLAHLVRAGAPVNALDRTGRTLLDVAMATRPHPAETVAVLRAHSATSGHLTEAKLGRLLERLSG